MVEKMQLLHITGPREDIDRVMDVYLSKYEIHFENAPASLNNLTNVRPFVETNVYKESYARAKVLWDYLKNWIMSSARFWNLSILHSGQGAFRGSIITN